MLGRYKAIQSQLIDIIFLYIICNQDSMTNPFQALNISDDEDTFQQSTEQKVKRTHQEKRIYKQQQEAVKATAPASAPVVTEQLPERHKENAKVVRHNNRGTEQKPLGQGHYLDRRSGTGRVDKPRKEGGGWGNVGNVKDELKKDKYIKQSPEKARPQGEVPAEETKPEEPVVAEQKPEEPAALTLEQYYKSKGVEISNAYEGKAPVKKGELNAEWIKKEKLTVLESKQDKKLSERNNQNIVKFANSRVGLDENIESLGFFAKKTEKKPEERREHNNQKPEYRGKGGKTQKAVIHEQDFPSL